MAFPNERHFPNQNHRKQKTYSWSQAKLSKMSVASSTGPLPKGNLRPHQLRYVTSQLAKHHSPRSQRTHHHHAIKSHVSDPKEYVALARSSTPLPGEKKWPSQFGVRCIPQEMAAPEISLHHLYDMGLLYNDEENLRFGLDDITHEAPLYTLNIRSAKRKMKRASITATSNPLPDSEAPPSPALSYYDIGDDEALATFAMDPDDYVDVEREFSE